MKKIIEFLKENKWFHYALIIAVGIILSIPLYYTRIRETHDGSVHFLRILGTMNDFKIGNLPPIVVPYFCNGGGYAMNLFYNPIVTYIPLIIKLFTPTYMLALKIFGALCIILSGITMYNFVNRVTKNKIIALLSAIFYLAAPYKLGDVYRRYAIGEFASFVFIPILFSGLYNLFNEDGKKHYLIGIGATCLVLTHTITAFYMALFSALYVVFNIKKLKEKDVIIKIIINIIFIVLISLFFIFPMLEAKNSCQYAIFDSKIMVTNGNYVYRNTLNIRDLFKHKVERFQDPVFCLGIPFFILFMLFVITYKGVNKRYNELFIEFIVFSFISIYMSTKFCPWNIFPDFFCKLQYPWRMIGFFNFFSSFVIAVNMKQFLDMTFKSEKIKLIITIIIVVITIVYVMPVIMQFKTTKPEIDKNYEESVLNNLYVNHMHINRDYLPVKALVLQKSYLMERDYNKIEILQGNAEIENENKVDLRMTAKIRNIKEGTILEFPFFYYPGYQVSIKTEDKEIQEKCIESENGFTCIKINEKIENAELIIEYKATKITKISYLISFVSTIAFVTYIVFEEKKQKSN